MTKRFNDHKPCECTPIDKISVYLRFIFLFLEPAYKCILWLNKRVYVARLLIYVLHEQDGERERE